jgi:hypothetical protein
MMRLSRNKVETDAISATFAMSFAGGDIEQAITATLEFNVSEPFAVTASFLLSDAPAVQWVIARELLREGVALPSGMGDVRIYPTEEGLFIDLHSPGGRAVLQGPIEPVIEFVARIYKAVPESREHEFFSFDAELDRLADLYIRPDNGLEA